MRTLKKRKNFSYKIFLLLAAVVFFETAGQTLYKVGINGLMIKGNSYIEFLLAVFSCPLIWLGVFCFWICFILWLVTLSKVDLSFAFPIMSVNYITILFSSYLFLNEHIGMLRIIGISLIVLGVIRVVPTQGE